MVDHQYTTVGGAMALWLLWKIWRFVLSPTLYPQMPKTLPYNIPWFGHIIPFITDNNGLITRARLYFGNTREPFALVLGGQYLYILTSAKDVTSCFQNPKDLTFDSYIEDMQLRFGASAEGVKASWQRPSQEFLEDRARNGGFPNPHGKPVVQVSQTIYNAQLHPGGHLEPLSKSILSLIHEKFDWRSTPDTLIVERNEKDTERVMSLHRWIQYALFYAVTKSFFGEAIFKIDPNILEYFAVFDQDSWQFTYQVPAMFARKMINAKNVAQKVFDKYIQLPASDRSDACWMIHAMESEMRAVGNTSKDISAYLMMFYWVANANAWKVAFWLSNYILFDPELKSSVEKEARPLFNATVALSPEETSLRLENSPVLVAAFHETLRLSTSSITIRDVVSDCFIGNTRLQKGSRVLIPYRQTLMDEKVFGPDVDVFRIERFLEKPSLAKDSSFRPFGGGLNYCPGRFLAKKEVLTVVGLLFSKHDICLQESGQAFPQMATKKPGLGIAGPAANQNVLVRVRKVQEGS